MNTNDNLGETRGKRCSDDNRQLLHSETGKPHTLCMNSEEQRKRLCSACPLVNESQAEARKRSSLSRWYFGVVDGLRRDLESAI